MRANRLRVGAHISGTTPQREYNTMAKKILVPTVNSNVITLGLDIGYGVVKAVTNDKTVIFSSVMGHGHEMVFRAEDIINRYPGMQLYVGNQHWFVGDLALSQLGAAHQRRLRGRTANEAVNGNEFRRRLMSVALAQFAPNGITSSDIVHFDISTGLPVDHMRDAAALKDALMGQHFIRTDQTQFVANVRSVYVMPQPYGAIYSQMITQRGELNSCYTLNRVGVLDVGTYTIDAAVDHNGDYISRESGSLEGGIHTAQQFISEQIESDYRQKPDYRMVEDVLKNGYLSAMGKREDYRQDVQAALQPLRESVISLMSDKWQQGLNLDGILLAGGGASLVEEVVKQTFPHASLITNPHTANARGYLQYALNKASN